MSVVVYLYIPGRNSYTIANKRGTHVGLVKSSVKFEDELCGSNRGGMTFLQNFIDLTNIKISIKFSLGIRIGMYSVDPIEATLIL